jgi:glutamyl-tRNA reductase
MGPWPPVSVLSLSHRRAEIGLREGFARSRPGIVALLTGEHGARRRGVVLSTCNRFEAYWWGSEDWATWFRETASQAGTPLHPAALVSLRGVDAVRHLFRVTIGLDSQIAGETEIQGQVRSAWGLARDAGATCRELDAVFAAALAAGRRIRRATGLGRHTGSLGAAAVAAARAHLGDGWDGLPVAVIGAGDAARAVVAALAGSGARVNVLSRRFEQARALAESHGLEARPWEDFNRILAESGVIFTATAAPHPFLTASRVGDARGTGGPELLLIDLGVPRNVAPNAAELPGVRVLDLDDLPGTPAGPDLDRRFHEAEQALEVELACLLEKLGGLAAGKRLADLHRTGERLAAEEAARTLARLPGLTAEEREAVRRMAVRLVRRVLYPASRSVRVSATATVPARADNGG